MNRLFIFGCSNSVWSWPTWAQILKLYYVDKGYQVLNFAKPGISNIGILQTIQIAKELHQITDDDLVCVLWTTFDREDVISPGPRLDLVSSNINIVNVEHYIVSSSLAIVAANDIVNINFNGFYLLFDHNTIDTKWQKYPSIDYLFKKLTMCKQSLFSTHVDMLEKDERLTNFAESADSHSLPAVHLKYVENVVAPTLGIKIPKKIKDTINKLH